MIAIQSALARAVLSAMAPLAALRLLAADATERMERSGIPPVVRRDRPVWLHGASLGEMRGLMPVVDELRRRDIPVHVTCMTASARALLQQEGIDGSYVPLDHGIWVRRFLDAIAPRALVLAETEIWPVLLEETAFRGVPCVMVNARLSPKSMWMYRPFKRSIAGMMSSFAGIGCRTPEDRERFVSLGVDPEVVSVMGDTKAAAHPGDPPAEWSVGLPGDRTILVAGSTREGEEFQVVRAALET